LSITALTVIFSTTASAEKLTTTGSETRSSQVDYGVAREAACDAAMNQAKANASSMTYRLKGHSRYWIITSLTSTSEQYLPLKKQYRRPVLITTYPVKCSKTITFVTLG